VPWVQGAALAIRRKAFQAVDGFDETFFMYFEETDLCSRLGAAGWEVHFAPVTTIVHAGGASTRQLRTDMAMQLFASLRQFYQRHYTRKHLAALVVIVQGIMLVRWIVDSVRLRVTRDAGARAAIAENVVAWQRVLLGYWRGQ
jgi:GT2 family glycosyltransferase